MKKWYQSNMFKNIMAIISILVVVVPVLFWINNFVLNKAKSEITKTITDSLQYEAIRETRESIGVANSRIDVVQTKQNMQEITNSQMLDNQKHTNNVLQIIITKIDKNLLPLLQDKQSEWRRVDSLKTVKNNFIKNNFY